MKCPRCESALYRKNGHRGGKQNYLCKNCGRQFTESASSQLLPKAEIAEVPVSSNGHVETSIAESILSSVTDFAETESLVQSSQGIAILLLDIENLKLDINTENFLASICSYPLQVKIAFANWRNTTLGKQDVDLYERGYQLVHVPGGKDSADGKMIAVGSSLFLHYPNIREVFVCSCDWILTHLCNQLQNQGVTVYWVRRQDNQLKVENRKSGEVNHYSLALNAEIPSWEGLVNKIESLLKLEQKSITERIANFSTLASLVQERRQIRITENSLNVPQVTTPVTDSMFSSTETNFIASISDNQDIISANSTEKVIPQNPISIDSLPVLESALIELIKSMVAESKEDCISVNQLKQKFLSQYKESADSVVKKFNPKSSLIKFFTSKPSLFKLNLVDSDYEVAIAKSPTSTTDIKSPTDLEQVLKNIVEQLIKKYSQKYIPIESLGSEFHKEYGVTITAIMKHLELENSFNEFVQSCSGFKVKKSGTKYQVTLA
jgi:hypothetical protein